MNLPGQDNGKQATQSPKTGVDTVSCGAQPTRTIKENNKEHFTLDQGGTLIYFTLFSSFIAIMQFMLETSYECKNQPRPSVRDW